MSGSNPNLTPILTNRLPCFWLSGNLFQNGHIETTDINMNPNYSITNLHDPVNPQDAATKHYIDQKLLDIQSAVQLQDFTLTGTEPTWIDVFPDRGSFVLWITGKMPNGPSVIYAISKSKTGDGSASTIPFESGNIQRINQSGAIGSTVNSFVRLTVTWNEINSVTGLQQLVVTKMPDDPVNDLHAYDGTYEMMFLGSDGI